MRRILLIWAIGLAYYSSWGQTPADTVLANQYYRTADTLTEQGKYEEANRLLGQAQRIYQKTETWERYVACLNSIAFGQWFVAAYDSATAAAQCALRLSKKYLGEDHPETALSYDALGYVAEAHGSYVTAHHYYRRALHIRRKYYPEDHLRIADSYTNLGFNYRAMGDYNQALTYHERELKIRLKFRPENCLTLDNRLSIISAYNYIGDVYLSRNIYNQALRYYQKAVAVGSNLSAEMLSRVASSYNGLGLAYEAIGDYDRALIYLQKSLAYDLQRIGETHPDIATGYGNIATVYAGKQEYDRALMYCQKALALDYQLLGRTHPKVGTSYANIGVVYHDQGINDQALLFYQKALKVYTDHFGELHPYRAYALNRIGDLEQKNYAYVSASYYYQQSLVANGVSFRDTSKYAHPTLDHYLDGSELLRTLKGKAEVLSKLTLNSVAYQTYLLADSLLYQLHRSYTTTADKVSLARTAKQIYEGAIQSALRQHQITQNRDYLQKAFYFSERSKAGVLTEALSASEARRFGQVPDTLIAQESALKADRSFYQSRLTSEDSSTYQAKLFDANRQYDSLMLVLETQYPNYHQLKYATRLATVTDVQSQLSSEEAVVSYFVGDSSRYAFTITQDQYQVTILPNDTLLDQRIQSLRRALHPDSTSHVAFPQLASGLYEQLLAPIVNDSLLAGVRRLTIVPDGAVGYLPFDLLLTQPVADNADYRNLPYLMRDFTIRYGYSATWLFHPFSRSEQPVQDQYIAFAPSYRRILDSTQQLALGRFRNQIGPLHFNQQEATNIRQHLSGVSLTNQSAVERRFKEEANQYDIIHLAMHALVDDENPLYSRLVFTPDATDTLEDGYLHAYELYDMELSASLAVLSACETGYGKLEQGEGIMSLARAFAYAGCPSIVMSHWLVDDAASAQLMNYFYKYLSEGLLQDEALRQAKLHYLQSASLQKAHPFFWSNFVLVGEATPIANMNASSTLWIYVIGSIVLLLGLGVIVYAYRPKRVFSN